MATAQLHRPCSALSAVHSLRQSPPSTCLSVHRPPPPRSAQQPCLASASISRARQACAAAASGLDGPRLPSQFEELTSQTDLDWVLADAEDKKEVVLVEWMAQWCRKCIYLKPKIEKLVHEYPSVRFCVVDVNKVPFAFVKGANITKMPTIQLWSKKALVEECIGGEAAWQVLDNIKAMIKRNL